MTGYYFIDPRANVLPGSTQESHLLSDLISWITIHLA